jgi:hypothetical protein
MNTGDFDWEEFLDLAGELVQRRGDISAERTAISRAYYAAVRLGTERLNAVTDGWIRRNCPRVSRLT